MNGTIGLTPPRGAPGPDGCRFGRGHARERRVLVVGAFGSRRQRERHREGLSDRRAANEFGDVPQAAQYIRLAADQIDSVSDAFRRRDLNQLVSDVQDFARRQPTAFLGMAVLAGFGVVRFLKTSANDSETAIAQSRQAGGDRFAGSNASRSYADSRQDRPYVASKGYRNEFTR